jgi:dTDP-glucose 4,6-dehydratase|tara:strand:+ start:421 stop:1386 length:966 start_codon:yes stop_codon:yes gene_type:complete
MKVFITGENGFIASNLIERMQHFNNIEFVSGKNSTMIYHKEDEPCVHQNDIEEWKAFFMRNSIDVIIHNAATVGTDVVALDSTGSTLTNVAGTYNICRAAKELDIPVCYMGTTVIYDTKNYQNKKIEERSDRGPVTLYGCQKLCAEDIIKTQTSKWMIVRPLFAYGGVGDMNSLIAKSIFGALNKKKNIDMFLDPTKIKDYMHVNDYCDAVLTAINQNMWYQDWNVAAETPLMTGEIVDMIQLITGLNLDDVIRWHPATDYLGNHMLTSWKFRNVSGWSPKISMELGIKMSFKSIMKSKGYNPLRYLEEAKERNIDLTEFY